MLLILKTAINAIFPMILLILFGYWLKKTGFLSDSFIKIGNKFVFRVCLACSLFINVYSIRDFSAIPWDFVIYIVAVICVLFGVGLVFALASAKTSGQKGVILHAIFRSNFAIIGLALASALGGEEAASVAAVASAFAMPIFNVFGVIALTVYTDTPGGKKHTAGKVLLSIVKNPMIIGAFFGLVCLLLRQLQTNLIGSVIFSIQEDLPFIYSPINSLKSMASPLALVILGAQFEFSAAKGMFRQIAAGTLGRIVLAPLLGIGGAILLSKYTNLFSCGINAYPTLIALFGSPAAVSTAVMAGEMGGDEQLAAQIVVWSSLGSVLTIFLTVCVLMATGFLTV